MVYNNLDKELEMLNAWAKKISKKAFIFVTSRNVKKKGFAVARSYYGQVVPLSDFMTLSEIEYYLYGIVQYHDLKKQCEKIPYCRSYNSGYALPSL